MICKYPRTKHVRGSRFQHGDDDLEAVPWEDLAGKNLVIEEKMDGANAGISFEDGKLMLQSRGHYLRGGVREKQFALLKQWAAAQEEALYVLLGEELIMYGEWMFAKHTCYYDALPHYFMEFDMLEKKSNSFLSTHVREALIINRGVREQIVSVKVLAEGQFEHLGQLLTMIGPSHFRTPRWRISLLDAGVRAHVMDVENHTDLNEEMEGLYIKWEENGEVKGRYKFVRDSFTSAILAQDSHWFDRPIVRNGLADGAHERMFL